MSGLRVSLLQQPLVWHDPAANRAHFEAQLAPLEAYREKFPAHLDADRFTLEP
ncbi:MAG TPA: hypothetical protein VK128_07870 [Steroidobacteraceae bacterium]|nr:hypothetical protein [Steroidobacteraceae bacterium]